MTVITATSRQRRRLRGQRAAVAATTTLTVADNNGGRLWKQKGEGAGPTWLLSIINERA